MTLDPGALLGAAVGLATLQLTSLAILVAMLRFFYLRLDRRFADVDGRFTEVRADLDRRFAEVMAAMRVGLAEARDDRRRIEDKLDGQSLEVARLQGIVERTHESHRFTVGVPDAPPRVASDIPDEPPAAPTAVGRP